jgi:MATE family multidrug resistance protein
MGSMSALHIGAVGLGAMVFNFIYWNFGFLRMGTTGITAQAYGKKDDAEIAATLSKALFLGGILAVLILLFQGPLLAMLSYFLNVSPELSPLVNDYFFTRVWAAPATFALYVLFGWYFGMQNAVVPLILTIIVNVVNILLSVILVKYYGFGVKGVAWGTVAAQYTGLLVAILILNYKYNQYFKNINLALFSRLGELKSFLKINANIFIRTVCLTFAFGFFYSMSAKESEVALAVNVILLQFINWMSYGIDGFAYASESLVGRYYGAKAENELNKAVNYSLVWGLVLAIIYAVVYYFGGEMLLSIFTNDQEIITLGMDYLPWMALIPILGFASYIWDGVFIGFTAGTAMRNSMLVSFVLYLAAYYALSPYFENMHVLWLSLSVFLLARGLIQSYMYFKKEEYLLESSH